MVRNRLEPEKTALLIIDVQDKLFSAVEMAVETLGVILQLVKGCQILSLPVFISEQAPEVLGLTVGPLKSQLGHDYKPWKKTTFSCMDDVSFLEQIKHLPYSQWILVGFEAHICVLQTAIGLLSAGKEVLVVNNGIASRSIYDFSTGIAEMRDEGVRISSAETILFELIKDSKHPDFKLISQLVKTGSSCCQNP